MLSGIALGAALSCKFVGLFVVALIGIWTLVDLWAYIGEIAVPAKTIFIHFVTRIIGLIVVPAAVYVGCFWIHFSVLSRTGKGDVFHSPAFQATLEGNPYGKPIDMPRDLAFGSLVTLEQRVQQPPCLLHSHPYRYPVYPDESKKKLVSSQQQQVCSSL